MTGKDVGLALGLDPFKGDSQVKCSDVYAEYPEPGSETGAGFCLSGVTDDPVEEVVLAMQITGYERTETVQAYAAAVVALDAARIASDTAEAAKLLRNVSDLAKKVEAQGPVEGN